MNDLTSHCANAALEGRDNLFLRASAHALALAHARTVTRHVPDDSRYAPPMPPTPDPRANPYAPPAAAPVAPLRAGVDGSYERERRSVVIVLVLTVVTLGVYPGVWYVRRARFLDALSAQRKLGSLPYVYLALYCFALITGLTGMPDEPQRALDLVTGITSLVLAFRTARVLRSDLLRTGRMIDVSSLAVFFFGCAYLQYLVNRAAETPARLARPGA